MRILLAVDGSKFTKKALAFLSTHEGLAGPEDHLVVLHVQPPLSPRVKSMVGADAVREYQAEESAKVLKPIEKFLKNHAIPFETQWVVGSPVAEIIGAAKKKKAHMIVMGTHGHGLLGRALMGSVAQRVVADSDLPVLLVK
ncbi:universal stress protein [Polaromonas sp. YR568]|uniref:universal stress protein n=1 Tax=Polaromonas sp. YR568 TaxID=1855301 RepID=UPI003137E931